MHRLALPLICGLVGACPSEETPPDGTEPTRATEPFPRCADSDPLRRPFFGDTHVHTTLSLDANLQGTRTTPAEAYRFAMGEPLGIQPFDASGQPLRTVQLDRPLDFVVLSDHAEFLGTVSLCSTPGSPAYDTSQCETFRDNPDFAFLTINAATAQPPSDAAWPALCGEDGAACLEAGRDVWQDVIAAAEAAYDRTDACTFTSFVGYEWSGGPATRNLHRNVVFRHEVVPGRAFGYFDGTTPEALWTHLEEDCLGEPPCDVLTIPHNANLSNGLMFSTIDDAAPLEAEAAARRAAREPLYEIFQHKGDGECWPGSPAADELCGFEKLPYNTLSGANLDAEAEPVPRDFLRDVLAEGLRYAEATGVNPYRYGVVASTDTHLGTPGLTDESTYPGHGGAGTSNRDALSNILADNPTFNPGGLAVLWAEENSREALFQAMQRREAYGTSGPRLVLRLFGGPDLPAEHCDDPALAATGYDLGVPMGGTLPPGDGPPTFTVAAESDPGTEASPGRPLQRLQIVKGWLEADGTPQWAVYDVAGDPDATAGVDPDTCEVLEDDPTEGFATLCATWTDPDHEPGQRAFYYARALETPRCRWHTAQCRAAGITCPTDDPTAQGCCDDRVEAAVQERAWSSPIWTE